MTLARIADLVDGRVADDVPGAGDVVVDGAAYVDSRTPVPGGLFVAVVGERVDGHRFADGAHAVLGQRPTSAPTVVVAEPVAALGRLARGLADDLGAGTVALTGSQGKTSTKDLLAAVLASDGATVATAANNNNELGVPLTVLRAGPDTRHLVVEMGARGIGHIAYLCDIAPPDVAAVLNVGTAHVGEFGGVEAIARAKGEIVEALSDDGVAVLNADDPLVAAMAGRTRARVLTFGADADVRWRGLETDHLDRARFELGHRDRWEPVRLQVSGAHQMPNAAAAAAMALARGLDLPAIAAALSDARPASRWRMEVHERSDGLVVVNDAYNANPASTKAALDSLAALGRRRTGRTIAVLGEMRELGDQHEAGHRAVGEHAAAVGVDLLVVVGTAAEPIAAGARAATTDAPGVGEVIITASREEATAVVGKNAGADDVVLVKASRGAALERVAEDLLDHPHPDPHTDPHTDAHTDRPEGRTVTR